MGGPDDHFWTVYSWIGNILGVLAFIGVWIAAVGSVGRVVGIALGWVPALLAAFLATLLGPAVLAIILAFIAYLWVAQ